MVLEAAEKKGEDGRESQRRERMECGGTPRSNAKEADDRGGDISEGRWKVLAMNASKRLNKLYLYDPAWCCIYIAQNGDLANVIWPNMNKSFWWETITLIPGSFSRSNVKSRDMHFFWDTA